MCWFRSESRPRLLAALAVPLLAFGLACVGDPDDEDHTPTVEDSQFLDWELTAQWPTDMPAQNPFSGAVLTADGQRLLLSYGAQGGRGLMVLDVSRYGELLVYAHFEETEIQFYRAEVHGDDVWTLYDGHLQLWDLAEVGLSGATLLVDHVGLTGVWDFEVTADHVYIGTLEGLYIFERELLEGGPAAFTDAIGFVETPGAINDYSVTAQGTDWVWLGGLEGKALIDVADKTQPSFVRSLGDLNEQQVFIVGDLLVSHGRTWDVSDPNNPEFVAFLPFTYGFQTLLDEDTVVSSSEGLVWTDFSQDPPLEVRRIETTGQFTPLSNGEALFGVDDFFVYRVEAQ